METWTALDEHYSVGEFRLKLFGWKVERRFVVIREEIRETRASLGRKLIDVPGYTFRIFVTSSADGPAEIWRDYNRRADMENRIAELKHDLGAHGFCMKQFCATDAAFRSVLLLFNLLSEFQRAAGLPGNRSRPRFARQFSPAARFSVVPAVASLSICQKVGVAWKHGSLCWKRSWTVNFQFRRSWIRCFQPDRKPLSKMTSR